jgi:tetratricopeptide (TPR) repeat protein
VLLIHTTGISQGVDDRITQLYEDAISDEKHGRLDTAVQKYQAIIRLDDKLPAAYNNLGRLYYQQSRFEEAVRALKRALELDPKLPPTHALLGFSYFRMGDFKSARDELTLAVKLNPGDKNAQLILGRSLYELGAYKDAAQVLEKLQDEDPKNPDALYTLGLIHMELAASTLGELQKVAPDSYLIELLLGRFAEIKQLYFEAIEHYKRALAKDPNGLGLDYALAHALWASGRSQEALPEYQRALKIDPYDYNASWEAARIVLGDNPAEAFRLSTRALELMPAIPEALSIRGRALLALRKPAEAVKDFKEASELDRDDASNHYHLAQAYRLLGMNEEAQSEITIFESMQRAAHTPKEDKQGTAP